MFLYSNITISLYYYAECMRSKQSISTAKQSNNTPKQHIHT